MNDYNYHEEQKLSFIRSFDVVNLNWEELMKYVQSIWHWGKEYFYKDNNEWIAITGGWSGNEAIIAALKENAMFWMLYWKQSNRGGKYVFEEMKKVESEE